MGHRLKAHDPEGGDVRVELPDAGHLHLHQGDHQDAKEDAKDVAENVHQHDGNQGDLKMFCLTEPAVTLKIKKIKLEKENPKSENINRALSLTLIHHHQQ